MTGQYRAWKYYALFLYYKLRIPIDCTSGRGRLLLSEAVHLIRAMTHKKLEMPGHGKIHSVSTIWGTFRFIGDLYGYLIMNPSFERPDMEVFIRDIRSALSKKKRVLFLDIGANVGLYTIGIPNRIGKNRISIHAFEPDPVYYRLLRENIRMNGVKNVRTHNAALGTVDKTMKAKKFAFKGENILDREALYHVRRLDSFIPASYYNTFDEIFMKIDIEGHEEGAMDGAQHLWDSGKTIHLMIEDCVNPNIVHYLTRHGWTYIKKITPYDSFWDKQHL